MERSFKKRFDRADIVRDVRFRRLSELVALSTGGGIDFMRSRESMFRGQLSHYHTSHRSAGARNHRRIVLATNASAKAGSSIDNGPITRYFAIG